MSGPLTQDQVEGLDASMRAKQIAEDLGYGPSGARRGGVLLIVVDHDGEKTAFGHAGGNSPLYDALLFAIGALLKKTHEMLGGEQTISSVRRWREGKRS